MLDNSITTEKLRKKFKSNFDLCNFAINIGRAQVMNNSQMTLDEVIDYIDKKAAEHGNG